MLQRLLTPTAGTAIGAVLILLGGIVVVAGASTPGTLLALAGFGFVLRFRVLAARRERDE